MTDVYKGGVYHSGLFFVQALQSVAFECLTELESVVLKCDGLGGDPQSSITEPRSYSIDYPNKFVAGSSLGNYYES
jgi:hypothetical protein